MSIATQRYMLGVSPGSNSPRIRCSMGDTSRDIKLLLYDSDGSFSIPSGVSAVVKGTKSNNVGFLHSCIVGDNYVIFTIVEDMSDVPGIVICEIQLTDSNGGIICTSNFVIHVEKPALSDDSDIGEVDTDIITGIITDIEVYKSSVNKIVSDYKDETDQAIEGLMAAVGNDVAGVRDAVANAVSVLNERMDLALQELNKHEVQTVLFDDVTNPLAYIDDTATLEADPTTFDYVDFYYKTHVNASGQGNWDKVFRFEPNSLFPTIVSVQPSDTSATNKTLYVHELSFNLSGTTITVLRSRRWYWDGASNTGANVQQSDAGSGVSPDNMYGGRVYKIVGVNISDIDELTDLRIGADGTVYQSAGTAIRTQFSAVNNKTASDISYSNTNSGLSATNVQAAIDENAEGLDQLNGRLTNVANTQKDFINATAEIEYPGSYFDFTPYIGKKLIGQNCLFTGSGSTFDIEIPTGIAGKSITTGLFVDAGPSPVNAYITEVQLDADDNQIYPTDGTHYVGHPMAILPGCVKIRLYCSSNGYTTYQNAVLTHAQLYTTTQEQVDYAVIYTPVNQAKIEANQAKIEQAVEILDDIAVSTISGSFYDFSPYINKPLFGVSSLFTGSGATFDIDISDLDLAGKTISTYIWIDALASYIDGRITEVQLDENGEQIYPTSGFHYVAHAMTILPECKIIRLKTTQNAYSEWQTATVTHAQLYMTGAEQVDYSVTYSVDNTAIIESVDNLKSIIGAEEIVTSNNQLDPAPVIGKTFGSVNDTIYWFPFGKTLAELGSGYTNFIMHMNTGSISGYFQLIKEDGTTDNGNQSFNTTTYSIANVVNPDLVRGVKIHSYSAASGISISEFGLTFNGLPVDTFATGIRSNITPPNWKGKKWVAYGDSITQGGKWERIVVKRTGLMLTNAGVGGSCVADVSGVSIASFTDSSRISALPADADVVTIMGGTNDYAGQVPIGDIPTTTPFDKTTFVGALCETVRLVQTQCPDALIVIMSNIGGRGTQGVSGEIPPRNSIGLSSSDYALGAEKVASFMGCPFVDVHRCGITPMNRVKYISDAVHPNEAGAELIARKVIDYLVNNYPI